MAASDVSVRALDGRAAAIVEVAAVAAAVFLTHAAIDRLGGGVSLGALSIVVAFGLASWLLRRRGCRWRDLGLRRPERIGVAAAWAVGLFLVDMLLVPPLLSSLAGALHLPAQHLAAFADLQGNLARYLVLLIPIGWGTAAFGEELVFRGFIARRLADGLGGTRAAQYAATVGQAALFALGHAYLGPRGMLNAGALGLVAGFGYRWSGRNLWPLFVAHGLVDSVGLTALYLGAAHS
jgi:hypothetical protein